MTAVGYAGSQGAVISFAATLGGSRQSWIGRLASWLQLPHYSGKQTNITSHWVGLFNNDCTAPKQVHTSLPLTPPRG
jgi:hypothetical protein